MDYDYYDEVLDFLEDMDQVKFMAWLDKLPPLEQTEAIRQYKSVLDQALAEVGGGDNDAELREALKALGDWADQYQELYLNEKLAELNYEVAVNERDKAFAEAMADMQETMQMIKAYARECIELNAPNADDMRQLALKFIELEQNSGTYDPDDWAWFEKS